jgi:hypothetical protein
MRIILIPLVLMVVIVATALLLSTAPRSSEALRTDAAAGSRIGE